MIETLIVAMREDLLLVSVEVRGVVVNRGSTIPLPLAREAEMSRMGHQVRIHTLVIELHH